MGGFLLGAAVGCVAVLFGKWLIAWTQDWITRPFIYCCACRKEYRARPPGFICPHCRH